MILFNEWILGCCQVCLQVWWASFLLVRHNSRQEIEQFKIHGMDKICLEFATFKEFGTAVLGAANWSQEMFVVTCMITFIKSRAETDGVCNGLKKRHLNRRLGSIAKSGEDYFQCLLVWGTENRALVSYWNRQKMRTILILSVLYTCIL